MLWSDIVPGEVTFVAEGYYWPNRFPNPIEFAAYFMSEPDMRDDFQTACHYAVVDREVWNDLYAWAQANGASVSKDAKALLFDVLVVKGRPKPSTHTQRRNLLMRQAAGFLVEQYGLTRTRNATLHGQEPYTSAAAVLAQVNDMPSEAQIQKTLLTK